MLIAYPYDKQKQDRRKKSFIMYLPIQAFKVVYISLLFDVRRLFIAILQFILVGQKCWEKQ